MKKLITALVIASVMMSAFAFDITFGRHQQSNAWDVSAGQWFYLGSSDGNYSHSGTAFRFCPEATVSLVRNGRTTRISSVGAGLCAQVSYWVLSYGFGAGPVVSVALDGLTGDDGLRCVFSCGGRVSMQVSLGNVIGLVLGLDVLYRDGFDAVISLGITASVRT